MAMTWDFTKEQWFLGGASVCGSFKSVSVPVSQNGGSEPPAAWER